MVLLPHQRANVAILLGLLAALPDDKYNHSTFGFRSAEFGTSPDSGCALGLAYSQRDKFDLKAVGEFDGVEEVFPVKAEEYGQFGERGATYSFGVDQFGVEVYERVFDSDAYGMSPENVTKQMVMERLAEFA